MTMTFNAFMSQMLRPTYVYRMAKAKAPVPPGQGLKEEHPRVRGARTAMARAQREIDDLVLQRAQVIADERRCAAVSRGDSRARCEFHRGHGPVGPGVADSRLSHVTARRDWDHGAPKAGVWWMNEMTQQMENADG